MILLHNLGEIWGLGMPRPLFAWGPTPGNVGEPKFLKTLDILYS